MTKCKFILQKKTTVGSVTQKTTYLYDQNDRLLSETTAGVTTTYRYDNNGNLLSKQATGASTNYSWNQENQLSGATITQNGTTQQLGYQYDTDGVRVAAIVDGVETRYLVDTNRQYAEVIEEYRPGGQVTATYVQGLELISQTRARETSIYLYDGFGTVRALSNEAGQVTDRYAYDAYGNEVWSSGGTENSYGYRGEQTDENLGLQYLRSRYYDTSTGRFVSVDPFEGWQEQPVSRHRYIYGNNNPTMYADPSGAVATTAETSILPVILEILASIGAAAYVTQTSFALKSPSEIEWDGALIADTDVSAPFIYPGFPASVTLGGAVLEAAPQDSDFVGYWLIVQGGQSYSETGIPTLTVSPVRSNVKVFTPRLVGKNLLSLAGEVLSAEVQVPNFRGAGFTIGFGKGYFLSELGDGTRAGITLSAGLSIPFNQGRRSDVL